MPSLVSYVQLAEGRTRWLLRTRRV
jgi:hypothetical protein